MLSSVQAGGVSIRSSLTLGLSQDSCNSFLTMFNIMFKGFSTGVLLGDGVQSNEDVYKMKSPVSSNSGSKYHISFLRTLYGQRNIHIPNNTSFPIQYVIKAAINKHLIHT